MKRILILILLLLTAFPSSAVELDDMTLEEKVGQLFIIRPDQLDVSLNLEDVHDSKASGSKKLTNGMLETLEEYPAGGFVFFGKIFVVFVV